VIEQKNIKNGTHVFFSFGNDLHLTKHVLSKLGGEMVDFFELKRLFFKKTWL